MARYRFLDGMGDIVGEREFSDHASALAWVMNGDEHTDEREEEIQRVEFLGPQGDWRWAGVLHG